MTRLVRLVAFVALLAPLCLSAGCLQGLNERCQVQSDCQDGLLCVLAAGATPQSGGTCQAPTTASTDMAVTPTADLSTLDMTGITPPNDLTPTGD